MTTTPLPGQKGSKRNKPVLAVILGLILGPFGALYFGWEILVIDRMVAKKDCVF